MTTTMVWTNPRVLLSIAVVVVLLSLLPLILIAASSRESVPMPATWQAELRVVTEKKVGPGMVEVAIRGSDGALISGAKATLRGEMNHAGMKPVIVPMREVASGTYLADDFQFTMAGDWLLTVEAILPSGEKVKRTFESQGVSGG